MCVYTSWLYTSFKSLKSHLPSSGLWIFFLYKNGPRAPHQKTQIDKITTKLVTRQTLDLMVSLRQSFLSANTLIHFDNVKCNFKASNVPPPHPESLISNLTKEFAKTGKWLKVAYLFWAIVTGFNNNATLKSARPQPLNCKWYRDNRKFCNNSLQ